MIRMDVKRLLALLEATPRVFECGELMIERVPWGLAFHVNDADGEAAATFFLDRAEADKLKAFLG